ncbi:assimilatory nitrate reductase (NADH) alpha subunit apoprotein [Amphiplicatus metriothermophilus]|uniref:Assimilatory nitrate reductase (NADH) alpha subunit apoprotein n=2 Tax=Amphiplicatus metriothermophilus TaxID=1519374 RepID=A0A239PQD0_9PROT|nr:assimilatory nitrate reductase (NADH) alpha subunit apoprotein [Amphiplicatus metriothermophilus]
MMRVRTTCPYCGVGCGVAVEATGDGVAVKGDPNHPANFGRLCSKGAALAETLGLEDRLLHPQIEGRRASWAAATETIATAFSRIIERHGPDAVAFYVSGQMLIEDYYVANKLMKGFIGSANIDTNSRLCMASSVAGHKRAFGADVAPGCYEDLERADLVVLVGSNLAWCHPVLFQRIEDARRRRPDMRLVVVDPRRTATSEAADIHLPVAPGGDTALFRGLLRALERHGARDAAFVAAHTSGVEAALEASAPFDLARTARETRIAPELLARFFDLFIHTEKTVTVYSQGVNQAADGTDRVNAIINCHLLAGRIGKPGCSPFSVTGQPNAMGGREVGGLANQLACHMELDDPAARARVRRFWRAPRMADRPGLKAVDLFDAVHADRVKAVWIIATNPVVSMPDADRVREALRRCELVVVSDIVATTDTAACADILLPSTGWGEKSGMTTNSERRMSRQRAFLPPPGEARHDWRQICDVAAKMGWAEAFAYADSSEIFREYARLCALENDGARALDLAGLTALDKAGYEAFEPTQWPTPKGARGGMARLFADGRFFTPSGRANFVVPGGRAVAAVKPDYPYTLNTGRARDQWHTMTRTGRSPTLARHIGEPFVEMAPADAAREGLRDAEIVRVISPLGEMLVRLCVTARQRPGELFAPMHWNDAFAARARVGALVAPIVDPVSGQPALKASRVRIENAGAVWHAFAVIRTEDFVRWRAPDTAGYWAKARTRGGLRAELAGFEGALESIHALVADELFAEAIRPAHARAQIAAHANAGAGVYSRALFIDDVFAGAIYFARGPVPVARSFVCEQLGRALTARARQAALLGRPGADAPDRGAIVCSCMNVGAKEIAAAARAGCASIEAIGAATGAGTNCGSCRAEIARLLPEREHVPA